MTVYENGKIYNGFELTHQEEIPELKTKALVFRHQKTLAQLLVLKNNDNNKYFGVSFRTLAENDTGVPHILEHSVLNGSAKYPVKEPFANLLKQSLATFLNALTGSTCTMYPFCTRNDKDMENLLSVYWDAAYYPRISEHCFKQEGWHYELEKPEDDIVYKGVVYNEMKGSYSSVARMADMLIMKSLLPKSHYGMDTGGDPETIPSLTYEAFQEFHKKFYHPSNSNMLLYGDVDIDGFMKRLDKDYLSKFEKQAVENQIRLQQPSDTFYPTTEAFYPISSEQSEKNATYVIKSYYLDDVKDREMELSFIILENILHGMDSSPLKKALIESGLGEDIFTIGFDENLKQFVFNIGLQGTEAEHADKIDAIIQKQFEKLVEDGIDKKLIEAVINNLEFKLKEENFPGYPKALMYHFFTFRYWDFDENPVQGIRFEKELEQIKQKAKDGYFEDLIKKYLVNNMHSNLMTIKPDRNMAQSKELRTKEKLKKYKDGLTKDEIDALVNETQELIKMQGTSDSQEDIDTLPVLAKSDLDKTGEEFPCEQVGDNLYHTDVFTSGIIYLKLMGDIKDIPTQYYTYLGLFDKCFKYLGTSRSSEDVELDMLSKTGGIGTVISLNENLNNDNEIMKFNLNGKCKLENIDDLLRLMKEFLFELNTDNISKIKEIIDKEKNKLKSSIISSGYLYGARRIRSQYSDIWQKLENADGINQYKFLDELSKNFDDKIDDIKFLFKYFIQKIFFANNLIIHSTCQKEAFQKIKSKLEYFKSQLPDNQIDINKFHSVESIKVEENEGLIIPSDVQYVVMGGKLDLKDVPVGVFNVFIKLLKVDYLWQNIRLKGGAYGAFNDYDDDAKMFFLLSYRDPNIIETIESYKSIVDFLEKLDISQKELDKLIVGTIGGIDKEYHPKEKGTQAIKNYLKNRTKEIIQQERDDVLSCTTDDLKKLLPCLKVFFENAKICVVGGESKIKENKDVFGSIKSVFS